MQKLNNLKGGVRVINMRTNAPSDARPKEGESIIVVDRSNKILGNRHIMQRKHDDRERALVIARYKIDLEKDESVNGLITQSLKMMANRVKQGERICLACWCKPYDCHADLLVKRIIEFTNAM